MGMFAVIVGSAFFSMAVASSSGIAASSSAATPVKLTSEAPSTPNKQPISSSAELLCEGQGWGSETEACLAAIAAENGASREVRLIASAEPLTDIPNVF